jgi:hypothetical protein
MSGVTVPIIKMKWRQKREDVKKTVVKKVAGSPDGADYDDVGADAHAGAGGRGGE